MDDHEEAAAAALDSAALAEAPEDLNMAGATLHDDQRGTTVAVGLNVPALAATARALRLDERNAAAETARQQDELRRYRQDMAPLRPDQPRLREDFNRGGGRGSRRQAERWQRSVFRLRAQYGFIKGVTTRTTTRPVQRRRQCA